MEYIILVISIISILLLLFVLKKMGELKKDFTSLRDDVDVTLKELYSDNKKHSANILNSIFEMKGKEPEEEIKKTADELYEDAKEIVLDFEKCSTSFLQRRLGIGYSRAASLVDRLEDEGVVGPQKGSKPREVYMDATTIPEEYEEKILELFEEKDKIKNNDVEELLGVSDATATRYLDKLEEQVLIVQKGKGRNTYYERLPD